MSSPSAVLTVVVAGITDMVVSVAYAGGTCAHANWRGTNSLEEHHG